MKALTIREPDTDNLIISEDTNLDDEPIAVLLYTPHLGNKNNHYHIELNREQAIQLKSWLDGFIEETSK